MTMLRYVGFNGFEQFGKINYSNADIDFCDIPLPESRGHKILPQHVAFPVNITAIAIGPILHTSGLYGKHKTEFELNITSIAANSHRIWVLLENGELHKVSLPSFVVNEIRLNNNLNDSVIDETNEIFTHVAAGGTMSVAVSNQNCLYAIHPQTKKRYTFSRSITIKKISHGIEHCLILDTSGNVYSFGWSDKGQLGHGDLEYVSKPTMIDALGGIKITDIAAGGWHSAAVTATGDVYTWGWNCCGQLGIHNVHDSQFESSGSPKVFPLPQLISLPVKNDYNDQYYISEVTAGVRHTVLSTNVDVYFGSGWNKYGQLVKAKRQDLIEFQKLPILPNYYTSIIFVCGEWSTVMIAEKA